MLDAHSDPKGYYAVLGLDPPADAAAIRAAFHARAKLLHPDRNPDPGAQAQFQRLSEAYAVLKEPLHRLSYEAYGEAVPVATAIRPHPCCVCGGLSAQPRWVVVQAVVSCLVTARRTVSGGIFCPSCAGTALIRASLRTWLRGWWSPWGLVLTPYVLLRNLLGGIKPRDRNFELLLHQARAFAARGDKAVAGALVLQACDFAGADARRLDELVAPLGRQGVRLRGRWPLFGRAFAVQILPIVLLAGLAAGAARLDLPPAAEQQLTAVVAAMERRWSR